MAAAVIARSGGEEVLPLALEMIWNEDQACQEGKRSYGEEKQDRGRRAARRLLEKHGEYYKELKVTPPGDDLYASHNTRKAVVDRGLSFLFTRKEKSHP
jgi:hypothetical protein